MDRHITVHSIRAIIGLGNPGNAYYRTRHSIGFRILDALALQYGASWCTKDAAEVAEITINGTSVILLKPQTFMNSSGKVVPSLLKKGIKAEQILVVHDELEKPFGAIALKVGGSARGHNGLKSIMTYCGDSFMRLRFGIGRPDNKADVAEYVLTEFQEFDERVQEQIDCAVAAIEQLYV